MAGLRKQSTQGPNILLEVPTARRKDLVRFIKELGGSYLDSKYFEKTATHLVCDVVTCSEKFLGACVKGLWILTPKFIEDSYHCGAWLEEKEYQHSISDERQPAELIATAKRWRWRVSMFDEQPFTGWQVALILDSRVAQYERLLVYGGAKLIKLSLPLRNVNMPEISYVFMDPVHSEEAVELLDYGLMCLHHKFIIDTILKDEILDPLQYMINPSSTTRASLDEVPPCLSMKETSIVDVDLDTVADIQEIRVKSSDTNLKSLDAIYLEPEISKNSSSSKEKVANTSGGSSPKPSSSKQDTKLDSDPAVKISRLSSPSTSMDHSAHSNIVAGVNHPSTFKCNTELDRVVKEEKLSPVKKGPVRPNDNLQHVKKFTSTKAKHGILNFNPNIPLDKQRRELRENGEGNGSEQKRKMNKTDIADTDPSSKKPRIEPAANSISGNSKKKSSITGSHSNQNSSSSSSSHDTGKNWSDSKSSKKGTFTISSQDDKKSSMIAKGQIIKKGSSSALNQIGKQSTFTVKDQSVKTNSSSGNILDNKKNFLTGNGQNNSKSSAVVNSQKEKISSSINRESDKKKGFTNMDALNKKKSSSVMNGHGGEKFKHSKSDSNTGQKLPSKFPSTKIQGDKLRHKAADGCETQTSLQTTHNDSETVRSNGCDVTSDLDLIDDELSSSGDEDEHGKSHLVTKEKLHVTVKKGIARLESDTDSDSSKQSKRKYKSMGNILLTLKEKTVDKSKLNSISKSNRDSVPNETSSATNSPKLSVNVHLYGMQPLAKSHSVPSAKRHHENDESSGEDSENSCTTSDTMSSISSVVHSTPKKSKPNHKLSPLAIPPTPSLPPNIYLYGLSSAVSAKDSSAKKKALEKQKGLDASRNPRKRKKISSLGSVPKLKFKSSSSSQSSQSSSLPVTPKIQPSLKSFGFSWSFSKGSRSESKKDDPPKPTTPSSCRIRRGLARKHSEDASHSQPTVSIDVTAADDHSESQVSMEVETSSQQPSSPICTTKKDKKFPSSYVTLTVIERSPTVSSSPKSSKNDLKAAKEKLNLLKNSVQAKPHVKRSLLKAISNCTSATAAKSNEQNGVSVKKEPDWLAFGYSSGSGSSEPIVISEDEDMDGDMNEPNIQSTNKKTSLPKTLSADSNIISVEHIDSKLAAKEKSSPVKSTSQNQPPAPDACHKSDLDNNANEAAVESTSVSNTHGAGKSSTKNIFELLKSSFQKKANLVKAVNKVLSRSRSEELKTSPKVCTAERSSSDGGIRQDGNSHNINVNTDRLEENSVPKVTSPTLAAAEKVCDTPKRVLLIPKTIVTSPSKPSLNKSPMKPNTGSSTDTSKPSDCNKGKVDSSATTTSSVGPSSDQTTRKCEGLSTPPSLSEKSESDNSDSEARLSVIESTSTIADNQIQTPQNHINPHSWPMTYPLCVEPSSCYPKRPLPVIFGQWMEAAREMEFHNDAVSHGTPTAEKAPTSLLLSELVQLVQNEEVGVSCQAFNYLYSWLEHHPPTIPENIRIFTEAFDLTTDGTLIFDIIKGVVADSKSQAAILLFEYFISILEINFDHCLKSRDKKVLQSSLIIKWLWGSCYAVVLNSKTCQILKVFEEVMSARQLDLRASRAMCALVNMVSECLRLASVRWDLQSTNFATDSVLSLCYDLVKSLHILKRLEGYEVMLSVLQMLNPAWLKTLLVCIILSRYNNYLLSEAIQIKSLSLKSIVTQYFFLIPPLEHLSETGQKSGKEEPMHENIRNSNIDEAVTLLPTVTSPTTSPVKSGKLTAEKVNKRNGKGESEIHKACMKNNASRLEQLLSVPGANVNMTDNCGWTPLHEACNHGSYACVELLLKYVPISWSHDQSVLGERLSKVDLNAPGPDGVTPLHDAVISNKVDVCKLLLQYGGSRLLKTETAFGNTALDLASTEEMKNVLNNFAQSDSLLNQSWREGSERLFEKMDDDGVDEMALLASRYKEVVGTDKMRAASRSDCAEYLSLLCILVSSYYLYLDHIKRVKPASETPDSKDNDILVNMKVYTKLLRRHVKKLTRTEDCEALQANLNIVEAICLSRRPSCLGDAHQ